MVIDLQINQTKEVNFIKTKHDNNKNLKNKENSPRSRTDKDVFKGVINIFNEKSLILKMCGFTLMDPFIDY